MALDGGESLCESPLDRLRQLASELLELAQALLEIGALAGEVVEPLLLRLVLLTRERVHLAQLLAPAFEALELCGELVAVALVDRLGARRVEAALRVGALCVRAREL